jgi:dTDP-4-amino-4,6-dideoxygalactose transaminase
MTIQLFKPKYRKSEILKEIGQCLDLGWTGIGYKTEIFEENFKNYTKFENAHFLSSNTSGLELAVKILKQNYGWEDGDEIITTPLTFVSTNHSIVHNNLKPVFADVDEQLCLDLESAKELISKKTKAIMFVGIGGNIGQYYNIFEFCKKNNLKLILDAAHMMGTKVNGIQIGKESDAAVFSFQAVKNLPTADSGMICFKEKEHDSLARKLSWLGIDKNTYDRIDQRSQYKWDYDVIDCGFKYHGNSVIASMGIVGLKYLDSDNKKRRKIVDLYEKQFKDISIKHNSMCLSSRHLYQIKINNRNGIIKYLSENGIHCGVHYKDNTEYQMYSSFYGKCPNAHRLSNQILTLPLHLFLTEKNIKFIIEKVKEAIKIYCE